MASLWDQYQARYKKATGVEMPSGSSALEMWGRTGTPELAKLRGYATGPSSTVSNASASGTEFGDRELSEARNLESAIEGTGESVPEQALGFLEGALGVIDRGRAAVTGAISGGLNMAGRAGEAVGIDNPLDEWTAEVWNDKAGDDARPDSVGDELANSPLGRFWRGLSGAEKYGAGDFEGPLKFQEDDSFGERAAKSLGTFVTEVGLDPLTYLTFGAGAVGKQAASLSAKGAATLMAKDLGEEAVQSLATRNSAFKALREAADAGDNDNVIRTVAQRITPNDGDVDETAKSLLRKYGSASATLNSKEAAEQFATDQLVDELGQAFLSRGGRGVRRYLAENTDLTPEQAKKLWDSLPAEVKGGVRFSVPFTRTSSPALVGGLDNSILDRLALGGVADKAYAARGAVSTSKPLSAARAKISGESGEAWTEALTQSYKGARDPKVNTSGAFTTWTKLNDAKRVQRAADTELGAESAQWLEYAVKPISALPSDQQGSATELFQSFYTNPTLVKSADASPAEEAAWQAAETLRAGVNRKRDLAIAEGISVNEAKEYVSRVMTDEARQARAVERGSTKLGGTAGGLDPTKARTAFMEVVGEDVDGNLVFRPETIREINARSLEEDGYKLFEDDPVKIAAKYMSAMDSLISARRFTNRLRRDGLIVDAGETATRSVDARAVSETVVGARKAADALDEAKRYVDDLFSDNSDLAVITETRTARKTLDAAIGSGGVSGWLARLPENPAERMAAVEALMDAVRGVYRTEVQELVAKRATATGEEAAKLDRRIEAAEKAVADATIGAVTSASKRRSTLGSFLQREGWDAIGATADRDQVARLGLPKDLDEDAYVNRFARAVVESHYAVRDPNTLSAKALEVMTPLLGFWKTSATVFRGTGYLSRNIVGGVWNNLLMGVQKGDYTDTVRILEARAKAAGRLGDDITDPLQEAKAWDDGVKDILGDDRLYAYYQDARRQGLFMDTSRVEYTLRAGIADGSGTQYLIDAAAKKPRIAKSRRYRKNAPTDLFYRTSGERNKAQRIANKTVNNAWVNSMSDASTISEEYLRLSAFIRGAKRMQSDDDLYGLADGGLAAAALVKAAHFEYSDLSRVEQDALKFLVPFYVWTRNNVPLQFRALITQPKYMLALERAQEGLSGVFADDTEQGQLLQQYLPNFSNDRLGFVTPWNPTGGGQLVLGVESPAVDINRLFAWGDNPIDAAQNTLGRFGQEGVSGMNPFIKAGVEAATGRDSFTGAKLEGTVDAPNWARALGLGSTVVGEEQPQVDAKLANFVKDLIPQAGMVENLVPFGQPDRSSDRFASSWASSGLGLPLSTMSPDQLAGQVARRNEDKRNFLESVISARFPNITKEQYDKYRELASSGKYTQEQLRAWLEAANAS